MSAAAVPLVRSSLHNHCTFCDGTNTPEEMAAAAFAAGFSDFGFSSHSLAPYPPYIGVGTAQAEEYCSVLLALRRQYAGKMRVAIGIEQDFYAPVPFRDRLDYLIGAVHDLYDERTGAYYWVDGSAEMLQACIDAMFGGDAMAMVRHFYALTVENAQRYRPDVIAHFDLVVKNNRNNALFCESSETYRATALAALHACANTGAVFEVNTGGMYRGHRDAPYLARFLLEALAQRGARVMLSADAHDAAAVDFRFAQTTDMLREIGFSHVTVWENGAFTEKLL